MKFIPHGEDSEHGPAERFTGLVHVDRVRNPDDKSSIGCGHVRFTPGSRTFWHSHPVGQTLYVTDGIGLVGTRDGVTEIRPGDVVMIEPGEEHWHGAAPRNFMSHIAMQEADDQGVYVTWLEEVSEEDYLRGA